MALTKIDDRGLTTPIDLLDNEKIRFGTGNDLELYHDGSNSYIKDVGTGNLLIDQSTANVLYLRSDDLRLSTWTGTETYIDCNVNGSVELYYDNSKKLETTSTGYKGGDNVKAGFGDDGDLQIWHDGTGSQINNSTGYLVIQSDDLRLRDKASGHPYLKGVVDGAVELYHDNVKKLETHATNGVQFPGGLQAPDTQALRLGNSNDLLIYHDGTNSFIKNSTNATRILADDFGVNNLANTEVGFRVTADGSCDLYYDGAKTFETISGGSQVTGKLKLADGGVTSGNRLCIGTSDDLTIWHVAGNDTYMRNVTGDMYLQGNNAGTAVNNIKFENGDGSTKLYCNSVEKFATTSTGASVTGHITLSGELNLVGGSDGERYIDVQTGDGSALNIRRMTGGDSSPEDMARLIGGQGVNLYYDNVKKFETTSAGGTLTGALTVTNEINLFNGTTNASRYIDAGLGDDNSLVFRGCSGGDANHETLAQFQRNGAVELYHDNVKVIRTTSSGFNIGTHTGGQCLNQFNSGWSEFADDTDSGNIAVNTNVFLFVSAQKSAGPTTNYPTAIYHITYTGDITRLSQSADVFSENTDTDGRICVYKQANGQFRVKNRTGVNNKIGITVLHAQGV